MINRVLIRIKVIQILYSFLLVEKKFTLEGSPTSPTKEKRFAYSLYLDLLVLLIKVADNIRRRPGDKPLKDTKFISRLLLDDSVKSLLNRYNSEAFPLQNAVDPIVDAIKESGIYKKYLKESGNNLGAGEEHLWRDLFNLVIISNPSLNSLIEKRTNFTIKALERSKEMMNRTFVNFLASQDNIIEVEKALDSSLDKARELYMRLLYLPIELVDLEDRIIDDNRHKFLKNEEDINPNLRFVENRMVEALRNNKYLEDYISSNHISWLNDEPIMMRNLLRSIKDSETYSQFMNDGESDMHKDAELWRSLFKNLILDNQDFLETLEDKSVFWNDDLEIISTFVLKTFRRIEEGRLSDALLSKFKDEEDARFGFELLRCLYKDKESISRYIEEALEGGNWEKDRLAFMDIVIIETALAEILNFPKIPIQVSVNEYIEIAKSYSSARSGQFVHGLIGTIVNRMQKEGRLLKNN